MDKSINHSNKTTIISRTENLTTIIWGGEKSKRQVLTTQVRNDKRKK